jgi:hypothetical protein
MKYGRKKDRIAIDTTYKTHAQREREREINLLMQQSEEEYENCSRPGQPAEHYYTTECSLGLLLVPAHRSE